MVSIFLLVLVVMVALVFLKNKLSVLQFHFVCVFFFLFCLAIFLLSIFGKMKFCWTSHWVFLFSEHWCVINIMCGKRWWQAVRCELFQGTVLGCRRLSFTGSMDVHWMPFRQLKYQFTTKSALSFSPQTTSLSISIIIICYKDPPLILQALPSSFRASVCLGYNNFCLSVSWLFRLSFPFSPFAIPAWFYVSW